MIKKTLTSLVLGTACLFGSAKADIIDVPTNRWVDFQSYINNANPGDTLNLIHDEGGPEIQGNFFIDKNLNIEGNGYTLVTIDYNPVLTIKGNANVNINNLRTASHGNIIYINDNSSLNYTNGFFQGLSTENIGSSSIIFNSTGNLKVDSSIINAQQLSNGKDIYLEDIIGNVSITNNTFVGAGTAVYVANDTGSNLEILNNTINGMTNEAINLAVPISATGYIANNSISNCCWDINNLDNLGNLVYTNNNIWNTQDPPTENFYLDPLYINQDASDFRLQSESPLWNKGLRIEGKTDYFTNITWIGAHGEGSSIPEPGAIELLITGSIAGLGYKLLRKD
jgi:hypothetical protein